MRPSRCDRPLKLPGTVRPKETSVIDQCRLRVTMSHPDAELERQLWGPNPTNSPTVAERPESAHLPRFRAFQRRSLNGAHRRRSALSAGTGLHGRARALLKQAVAIGDCHGQELNRRNLHDPELAPAQVEPRPRGLAVARRQNGLENGIPDWKSVSLVRRARKYPRAPHAGLPRRSHASRIGLTRMEYHFLHMSGPASARDAGGADQSKRPIARRRRGPKLAITDRA
jgi:hypothetical protein